MFDTGSYEKQTRERSRGRFWGHWCVLDGDRLIAMGIKFLLPSVRHDLNLYLGIFTPCNSRCLLQLFSIQSEESRGNRSTENHVLFALNIPSKFYFNHSSASWVV